MLKIPENKTRKRLRITMCIFYLVQIYLCTCSYIYLPVSKDITENYLSVFGMLSYLGGTFSDVEGSQAFQKIIPFFFIFIVIPIVGFFFCALDKERNMKNIVSIICCLLGVLSILLVVSSYTLCFGSLFALLLYILTSFITTIAMMARVVKDPKKEDDSEKKDKK